MICIKCQKQTPDTDLYCHHCGTKLDITIDDLQQKLGTDIHSEQQTETEGLLRWVLTLAVCLLVSGWLFKGLWANPPVNTITPGFMPEIAIPAQLYDPTAPVVAHEDD